VGSRRRRAEGWGGGKGDGKKGGKREGGGWRIGEGDGKGGERDGHNIG